MNLQLIKTKNKIIGTYWMGYFSVDIFIVVYQRESAILPSTVQLTTQLLAVVVNRQTRAVGLTFQETLLPPEFVKGVIGSFFPNSYVSFIAVAIGLQMHEIKTKQIKDIRLFHSYPFFLGKLNLDQKRLQQCL